MRHLRVFIVAVAAGIAQPMELGAADTARLPRVGFLAPGRADASPQVDAFRQAMRDLGRIEGQNTVLELRWAEGQFDRLPNLANELVRAAPDVLVTIAPQGYRAVRDASRSIPIVIISCDPVESIVQNIARPAGNVTGVTCMASDITPKRLQLLKETLPQARRVAVLYNPFDPNKAKEVQQMNPAASALGVSLFPVEAGDRKALEEGVAAAARDRADALFVLNDPFMFQARARIAELAGKHRMPAMYAFREYVEAGGLMSYGTTQTDLYRRAAAHVDKVLKGAKPIDVPVEQARVFELVVNLKTARTLGITVPQSILLRADRIIE